MNKHKKYLEIAKIFASMSNCISYKVGCIAVKEGRIISTGYNGTPKNFINCSNKNSNLTISIPEHREIHHDFSEKYEIHAEQNLIIWASKNKVNLENSTIYSTVQPCWQCTKMLIACNIKDLYYIYSYDKLLDLDNYFDFYKSMNIKIQQINV